MLRDVFVAELQRHISKDLLGERCMCGAEWSTGHVAEVLLGRVAEATARAVSTNGEGPTGHNNPESSHIAARRGAPRTGSQRARVLLALFYRALTDEELEEATGLDENTIRPRRGELADDGYIERTGEQRLTRRGNPADVWRCTELGLMCAARLRRAAS